MGDVLPAGTFHIWGTWYGNIGPMGTHQLSVSIGQHHLRGHSTSGDTPSMGEYHTAYGEAPHMGTSPNLLKRPTYGDIPPIGTS